MIASTANSQYTKNVVIIQHLLPDTIEFLSLLKQYGWNVDRVVAVPYSLKSEHLQSARAAGFEVLTPSAIDTEFVTELLATTQARCGRFLLHEVGGYCAEVLSRNLLLRAAVRGVVEETKQGLWRYRGFAHELSDLCIFQIADNALKRIEGEFVGDAIARVAQAWWSHAGHQLLPVAVIGLGDIGSGVARAFLRRGIQVLGYDKDPARMISLAAQGVQCVDRGSLLADAGVVVGATGVGAFEEEALSSLRDEALLVSASSRRLEFPMAAIETGPPICSFDIFKTYAVGQKRLSLAKDGYPANFAVGSLPPSVADLMFAQIAFGLDLVADEAARPGIVSLPDAAASTIAQSWWDVHGPGSAGEWRFQFY